MDATEVDGMKGFAVWMVWLTQSFGFVGGLLEL